MRTSMRAIVAAGGVPLLLCGLIGCATPQYGQPPAPDPTGIPTLRELDPDDAPVLAEPVGSPTGTLRAARIPQMGAVVTDDGGWVLYRFDKDVAGSGESACTGNCAAVWPPVLTDGNPQLEGIPARLVGTVLRDDGAMQLTLGGWPLYRYVGDLQPGQWKGQMVNGTWWVVAPDGQKNLTCLPTATPTAATPPGGPADASQPEPEPDPGYGY